MIFAQQQQPYMHISALRRNMAKTYLFKWIVWGEKELWPVYDILLNWIVIICKRVMLCGFYACSFKCAPLQLRLYTFLRCSISCMKCKRWVHFLYSGRQSNWWMAMLYNVITRYKMGSCCFIISGEEERIFSISVFLYPIQVRFL